LNYKNKKGMVLVIVVIVMAVLIILGTALLQIAIADTKFSTLSNKKVQAHYIGRTGIEVGKKILDSAMSSETFNTIDEIAAYVQNKASALGNVPVKDAANVKDIGSFKLKFEKFGSDSIKINAYTANYPDATFNNSVTYIVKIKNSHNFEEADDWYNGGVNLRKNYGPDNKYIKGAKLGGKNKTQIPYNNYANGGTSTFRSEIIYFLNDENNFSLIQRPNSSTLTFDAFIVYIEGGILLDTRLDAVRFTISTDNVLINWKEIDPDVNPLYTNYGFENLGKYRDFVREVTKDAALTEFYHNKYSFGSGNYGIVYFAEDIRRGNNLNNATTIANFEGPGYYFFRSGVNLQRIDDDDLIKIDPNDPIIESINNYFKYHSSTQDSIWNYQ
jgi:hypothetical protein